jgi:hypothetical protein
VHSTRYCRKRVPMDMVSAHLAIFACLFTFWCVCKAGSTLRSSRAVPHPSTNRALRRLTSEVGRDPVHSTRYGRQRVPVYMAPAQIAIFACVFRLWCLCKVGSTLRSSRAPPRPSTNRALRRLTSEVGRDPVHSTRYGRQRVPMDMAPAKFAIFACVFALWCVRKAGSTLRSSRAVPHPSTNRALRRLTSEVGRDPVHSTRYGRQRWNAHCPPSGTYGSTSQVPTPTESCRLRTTARARPYACVV